MNPIEMNRAGVVMRKKGKILVSEDVTSGKGSEFLFNLLLNLEKKEWLFLICNVTYLEFQCR